MEVGGRRKGRQTFDLVKQMKIENFFLIEFLSSNVLVGGGKVKKKTFIKFLNKR